MAVFGKFGSGRSDRNDQNERMLYRIIFCKPKFQFKILMEEVEPVV